MLRKAVGWSAGSVRSLDTGGGRQRPRNVIGHAARRLIENVENSPTTPHPVGGLHGRLGRGAAGLCEG